MPAPEISAAVADRYGRVASAPAEKFGFPVGRKFAQSVGYSSALLDSLPPALSESFTGAGHPQPFVDARPGETLLDLGCGAGLDLLLYARAVGGEGQVIGLDMAQPMIDKARRNLAGVGVKNAEFLSARADAIPLPDASVDLVTANGIFNLSPSKDAVMRECVRVLKPGGRMIFAEIILKEPLPGEARKDIQDWFRCIGGADVRDDFLARLTRAGFASARILWEGRNARTGHAASLCAVVRADKRA